MLSRVLGYYLQSVSGRSNDIVGAVTKFACPECTFVQGTDCVDKALCA